MRVVKLLREFIRTLLAFLVVAAVLLLIAFVINLAAMTVSSFGLPDTTTFFIFGMSVGIYIKNIGTLITKFAEKVWQKTLRIM